MTVKNKVYRKYEYTDRNVKVSGVAGVALAIDHGTLIFRDRTEAIVLAVSPGGWFDVWTADDDV